MNVLKQQLGWILFGAACIAGIGLLLSAPRSITVPEQPEAPQTDRTANGSNDVSPPPPLNIADSLETDRRSSDQNPFRPPERWQSVTPQNPPTPPLPDLTLPKSVFLLPIPPSNGKRWVPIFPEIESPENLNTAALSQLNDIANSIRSANEASSGQGRSISDNIELYDRVYLEGQEKWAKGKITDESNNFTTFRFLSDGRIKRFNTEKTKFKKAENSIETFREELRNRAEITEKEELKNLVDRALTLGLHAEAADLVEDFARNQIASRSMYQRAATLYRQAGKPEKAIGVLQSALNEQNVKTHELLFLIARRQWELGLKQRAVDTLQKSMDQRPLFLKARLLRFFYLYNLGKRSELVTELKKLKSEVSGMGPDAPETKLYHFASTLKKWAYDTRSTDDLSMDDIPVPPGDTDTYSFAWTRAAAFRSRLQLASGKTEQAVKTLGNGLKQFNTSYRLWYNLGVIGLATNQNKLTNLSFSVCDQIAPYRIEHRLAQFSAGGGSNQANTLNAVQSEHHGFLLAYHRALSSLNKSSQTTSSGPGNNTDDGTGTDSPFSTNNNETDGTSDNSPFGGGPENDDQQTDNQDSPFGSSSEDRTSEPDDGVTNTGSSDELSQPADGGTTPSRRELFKTVYQANHAFVPAALGLAYEMIKEGNTNNALPLLRHHVTDSWLKQYLVTYGLILADLHEPAFQNLQETMSTPDTSTKKAYQNALTAYLQLKRGQTDQAQQTIDASVNNPDVTSYMNELKQRIEQSQKRRLLEDSFERASSSQETFLGRGWTSTPGNTGISIRRKDGQVTLSGTLNGEYKFPRISHPTNNQFISAEFSGRVPSAPEELIIGIGLINTAGTRDKPLLLVGMNPNDPQNNAFVQTDAFAPLSEWSKRPLSSISSKPNDRRENGAFSIRLHRTDASAGSSWSAEINGQKVELNTAAPEQVSDSDRSVVFFVTGPGGTSTGVHLDRFRLIHQLNR